MMSVHQTRYYAVYNPCQGEYVLLSIYWFVSLLITSHSPTENTNFSNRTLAYFSILQYCIMTNFLKMLYRYGATVPLLIGVSCAPLQLIVKVVGTAKQTLQKL